MTRATFEQVNRLLEYDPATGVFRWRVNRAGNAKAGDRAGCVKKTGHGYRHISILGTSYGAQHLAWLLVTGAWHRGIIDHVNGIRDDDRWCNLRAATAQQNCANRVRASNNRSGLKGVHWNKIDKKWKAGIKVDGVIRHLGYFTDKTAAHAAYCAAAKEAFGDFARAS